MRKKLPSAQLEKMDAQLDALTTIAKTLGPLQAPGGAVVPPLVAGDCDKTR